MDINHILQWANMHSDERCFCHEMIAVMADVLEVVYDDCDQGMKARLRQKINCCASSPALWGQINVALNVIDGFGGWGY